MTENQTPNNSIKRMKIGTIEGTAFILGILLLISVFFFVLPELAKFHQVINENREQLRTDIAKLTLEQERLSQQICLTSVDREIGELQVALYVLKDLETKSESPTKEQISITVQEIEKLITLLKTERPK